MYWLIHVRFTWEYGNVSNLAVKGSIYVDTSVKTYVANYTVSYFECLDQSSLG